MNVGSQKRASQKVTENEIMNNIKQLKMKQRWQASEGPQNGGSPLRVKQNPAFTHYNNPQLVTFNQNSHQDILQNNSPLRKKSSQAQIQQLNIFKTSNSQVLISQQNSAKSIQRVYQKSDNKFQLLRDKSSKRFFSNQANLQSLIESSKSNSKSALQNNDIVLHLLPQMHSNVQDLIQRSIKPKISKSKNVNRQSSRSKLLNNQKYQQFQRIKKAKQEFYKERNKQNWIQVFQADNSYQNTINQVLINRIQFNNQKSDNILNNLKIKFCEILLFLSVSEDQIDLEKQKLYFMDGYKSSKCFTRIGRTGIHLPIHQQQINAFDILKFIKQNLPKDDNTRISEVDVEYVLKAFNISGFRSQNNKSMLNFQDFKNLILPIEVEQNKIQNKDLQEILKQHEFLPEEMEQQLMKIIIQEIQIQKKYEIYKIELERLPGFSAKTLFKILDSNNYNYIQEVSIRKFFKNQGFSQKMVDQKAIRNIFKRLNKYFQEKIDFDDFAEVISPYSSDLIVSDILNHGSPDFPVKKDNLLIARETQKELHNVSHLRILSQEA